MLGTYLGRSRDTKEREKRGWKAWFGLIKRFNHSKLLKNFQAKIVEAVVESMMLFDSGVWVWQKKETKRLQRVTDAAFTFIWSDKKRPPRLAMQQDHINVCNIREMLNVYSIEAKIEKTRSTAN